MATLESKWLQKEAQRGQEELKANHKDPKTATNQQNQNKDIEKVTLVHYESMRFPATDKFANNVAVYKKQVKILKEFLMLYFGAFKTFQMK